MHIFFFIAMLGGWMTRIDNNCVLAAVAVATKLDPVDFKDLFLLL